MRTGAPAHVRKETAMTRHRAHRLTVLLAVPILALAACGDDDEPTPASTTPGTDTGLANPASVYCEEQGGTVEIVDEDGGQVGYCNLPDGTRIEEWEYFRAETGSTIEP
jgi:putative hemolysin